MRKILLLITVMIMMVTLTACTIPERPTEEDEVHIYQTVCVGAENFTFYEASVDGLLGSKDAYMLVTVDGDVEIPTSVYQAALEFNWEALCYRTDNGVIDKYVSARKATVIPEPIIEYVDKIVEIEVPGETIYTHKIIDDNFIAEDGVFYYYVNEDIVNMVYKQGNEMIEWTLLYDNNVVNVDKRASYSMIYYNPVYIGSRIFGENWIDAKLTDNNGIEVEFNSITELADYMALHYSFNEIKTDWIALTDNDPTTFTQGMWVDEEAQ